MALGRLRKWVANTVYLVAICASIYSWPYLVYRNIGTPMPVKTARTELVKNLTRDYAQRLGLKLRVDFRVGTAAASAGAFSGASVIVVTHDMLNEHAFSDAEVAFIIAHEVGHLARYDAYRFWTTWDRAWAEEREHRADIIGVKLAGCKAMLATVERHRSQFMAGFHNSADPHPHPDSRLGRAC